MVSVWREAIACELRSSMPGCNVTEGHLVKALLYRL